MLGARQQCVPPPHPLRKHKFWYPKSICVKPKNIIPFLLKIIGSFVSLFRSDLTFFKEEVSKYLWILFWDILYCRHLVQGEERRRAGGGQGRLTKRKQWLPFPWITSESGTQVRTMSFVHLPPAGPADQGAFISILSYYPGVLIASSFHASLDH